MRKMVATYKNLKSALICAPLIIHISCHGDWKYKGNKTYNLKFEDPSDLCHCDDLTEERLKILLGKQDHHEV